VIFTLYFGVAAALLPLQARDSSARVEKIAEGVYAIIHADATHDWPSGAVNWPHGNTGVVIGSDGVLVIDATYYPSRARADIALIRSLTSKPVRYLLNTHWHGDHTHGNADYLDAFPGLSIVGPRPNAEFIALNQARVLGGARAPRSAKRTELARLEAARAAGKDSTGQAFAPSSLLLEQAVSEAKSELAELTAIRIAPPTLLFDRELQLDLGGRVVVLRNWDRANSPADATAYLPAERVLFTGDIVVHPVPYVFGAYPGPWVPVLRQLEAIPVSALVPGHGPVLVDHAYTRQVRELLEGAMSEVAALVRQGKTLQEVQAP
jgi:glyoxylase-like metal-dependent hydrolase (beta-lactamase superfamily II)